jgi:hypothetical protein
VERVNFVGIHSFWERKDEWERNINKEKLANNIVLERRIMTKLRYVPELRDWYELAKKKGIQHVLYERKEDFLQELKDFPHLAHKVKPLYS